MARKRYHGARALLNSPGHHSTGAIVAEVEDTSGWTDTTEDGDQRTSKWMIEPDYCFQLSDCDRSVKLTLDWDTPEERKNSLAKVDKMIDVLSQFRDGLVVEQAAYIKRRRALDKKPKKS